jgi:hypothetical protein
MSGKTDKGDKMYVQDEKQKIVGNLPDVDEWDVSYDTSRMWTIAVILPQIGALVAYRGKSYEILSTTTYQEQSGQTGPFIRKGEFATLCSILRVTDEGEDAGEPTITVRADELTLI